LWAYDNPEYVRPKDWITGYSKKELATLTEIQRKRWLYKEVVDRVVAITTQGSGWDTKLNIWVLIDGKPEMLCDNARILPVDWNPPFDRL
jgi:hypothetical protein